MVHRLEIQEDKYAALNAEKKNFELRKYDRPFTVGDYISFTIKKGKNKAFEKTCELFQIKYILRSRADNGLRKGYCILSLEKVCYMPKGIYFNY